MWYVRLAAMRESDLSVTAWLSKGSETVGALVLSLPCFPCPAAVWHCSLESSASVVLSVWR